MAQETSAAPTLTAFAVFRVVGHDVAKLQRVAPLVYGYSAAEVIAKHRGPFNPSPVIQQLSRGVL
jgi:hypothetical protein